MDLSPQAIRTADFKFARKGYDPEEVTAYLAAVADELERAQNQATAMEARARAAVQRLQELTEERANEPAPAAAPAPVEAAPVVAVQAEDETTAVSRVLVLAQKTADETVAEAKAEAQRITSDAQVEADRTIDSTRQMSAQMIEEARAEARRAQAEEREALEGHVNSLQSRRQLLESDVDQLERFLADQRSRLRDAATGILDIVERVPAGIGATATPTLSAPAAPPAPPQRPATPPAPAAAPAAAVDADDSVSVMVGDESWAEDTWSPSGSGTARAGAGQ